MSTKVWGIFLIGAMLQLMAIIFLMSPVMIKIVTGASLVLMSVPLLVGFGIIAKTFVQMLFTFVLLILGAIGLFNIIF